MSKKKIATIVITALSAVISALACIFGIPLGSGTAPADETAAATIAAATQSAAVSDQDTQTTV